MVRVICCTGTSNYFTRYMNLFFGLHYTADFPLRGTGSSVGFSIIFGGHFENCATTKPSRKCFNQCDAIECQGERSSEKRERFSPLLTKFKGSCSFVHK